MPVRDLPLTGSFMARLTHKETDRILESINILNADLTGSSLSERLLRATAHAVTADIRAFDRWNGKGEHTGTIWYDPAEALPVNLLQVFAAHAHEHPLTPHIVSGRTTETLKITDLLPSDRWQRTGLFNEFYKLVGVQHQISTRLEINPDLAYSFTLSRAKEDFGEHDRTILQFLKPHLITAIKVSQTLEQANRELEFLELAATRGIIVLTFDLRLLFICNRARRLIQECFPASEGWPVPRRILEHAASQTHRSRSPDYNFPAMITVSAPNGAELHITVQKDLERGEIRLLIEELKEVSPEDFRLADLTVRESEILYWLWKGKTNESIGYLCGISSRTVQKHIEHIYRKLGVETRIAAMLQIQELVAGRHFFCG